MPAATAISQGEVATEALVFQVRSKTGVERTVGVGVIVAVGVGVGSGAANLAVNASAWCQIAAGGADNCEESAEPKRNDWGGTGDLILTKNQAVSAVAFPLNHGKNGGSA